MLTRHQPSKGDGIWTTPVQGEPLWGFEVHQPTAYASVEVQPARSLLGLRRIDDARPDLFGNHPRTVFDIEKLIRMAIHQSVLAFEILAGPATGDNIDADFILQSAFTDTLVTNLIQSATGALHEDSADWRRAVRQTLQAVAIGKGVATTDTRVLFEVAGLEPALLEQHTPPEQVIPKIRKLFLKVETRDRLLPAEVPNYDGLSDYLVSKRLET